MANNVYTIRLVGFYGEVEITCAPNSLGNGAVLRKAMVEDAAEAYKKLKEARTEIK